MNKRASLPFLLALLFLSEPALADAGCSPSDEAGWVATIGPPSSQRDAPDPVVIRGQQSFRLLEGEPLCADDLVRNPAGSARRVRLRIHRIGSPDVPPGSDYLVPRPNWLREFVGGLMDPFDRYLRRSSERGPPVASTATRGPDDDCLFNSGQDEAVANVVAEWGPVHISWRCGRHRSGPWAVLVTSGSEAETLTAQRNIVQLDPRQCRDQCTVVVTHVPTGERRLIMRLKIVPEASATLVSEWRPFPSDPLQRAMIGAQVVARPSPTGWQLQGRSLLWNAACDIPAAGQMAARLYGAYSPELLCDEGR